MRNIFQLTAYAVSCFLLNELLQQHYFRYCRSNIFTLFTLGESWYCEFVDACLTALQWSPLAVAAPLFLKKNLFGERDHHTAADA